VWEPDVREPDAWELDLIDSEMVARDEFGLVDAAVFDQAGEGSDED
jgi:hypothetical protein